MLRRAISVRPPDDPPAEAVSAALLALARLLGRQLARELMLSATQAPARELEPDDGQADRAGAPAHRP